MSESLLCEIEERAARAGFNLVGAVAAAHFDKSQPCGRRATEIWPECDTILVLGGGGSSLWQTIFDGRPSPSARSSIHPIADYTATWVDGLLNDLGESGITGRTVYPDDRVTLNFMQLAEAAGLGTVSPVVGQLIHPEFGLWVGLRAAVLLSGEPFSESETEPKALGFQPCLRCHRPCLPACPTAVYDGNGGMDAVACGNHRHRGNCTGGCDVRRACPVGANTAMVPMKSASATPTASSPCAATSDWASGAWCPRVCGGGSR